jgi:hypothetical protein
MQASNGSKGPRGPGSARKNWRRQAAAKRNQLVRFEREAAMRGRLDPLRGLQEQAANRVVTHVARVVTVKDVRVIGADHRESQ